MGWKTWVKRTVFRLTYYSGIEWLIARCVPCNAAVIVMYHGVCDDSRLPPEVDFHLKSAVFDRHMRMLKRRYQVVPLSRLLDRLESGERLRKEVVLTFDDGYRNNATDAHPILERHALPYTIYLATGYIGGESWLPLNELYALWHFGRIGDDQMRALRKQIRGSPAENAASLLAGIAPPLSAEERALARGSFAMLNWNEVRTLAARGVDFGSHTHTHCNMAAESPDGQLTQLRAARAAFAAETGRPPETFAYPFGHPANWNAGSRQNIIDTGHRCAILATGGLVQSGNDPFTLPRIGYFSETWYFACHLMLLFLKRNFQ